MGRLTVPGRLETTGEFRAREATRARLLEAAARVYAQFGYHGTTTRAIAAEADVNEVTLFRLFGTKEALLEAAVAHTACDAPVPALPAEPADPFAEVAEWSARELRRIADARQLMRKCFADAEHHPAHVQQVSGGVEHAAAELRRYVDRLDAQGRIGRRELREPAVTMLMATLIADALGRDELGAIFPADVAAATAAYARLFLVSLGVEPSAR